jgi:hypothetical protein
MKDDCLTTALQLPDNCLMTGLYLIQRMGNEKTGRKNMISVEAAPLVLEQLKNLKMAN